MAFGPHQHKRRRVGLEHIGVVERDHPDVHQAYAAALVLVRPDGHVALRDDADPADPGAVIDVVRGAKPLAGEERVRLEAAS